jgi:hypothetical protein
MFYFLHLVNTKNAGSLSVRNSSAQAGTTCCKASRYHPLSRSKISGSHLPNGNREIPVVGAYIKPPFPNKNLFHANTLKIGCQGFFGGKNGHYKIKSRTLALLLHEKTPIKEKLLRASVFVFSKTDKPDFFHRTGRQVCPRHLPYHQRDLFTV